MDVLLLGAVIRLLVQGRLTSVGDRLLTGWVCVQLTADLVYTVTSLRDTFSFDGPSPVLYTGSFVLLGGAVLHPSLALDPPAAPEPSLSAWRRLMLVGAASLIAPIVLIGLGLTGKVEDVATRSEEHTSELQSLMRNSYAGFR